MKNIPFQFSTLRVSRVLLLVGSALSVLLGIVLQNTGVLPFDLATLLFFSFVGFLLALYRPAWVFLLFVGLIPLEITNLAPAALGGTMVRPYQWLALLLLLAVGLRLVLRKLPFRLFQPRFFDLFPVLVAIGAFLSLFQAPDFSLSLKQTVVVTSFVALYFLGRIFIRTLFDVRQTLPFFLVSSTIVLGYAIWQNVAFLAGRTSFEVMAGRPNATFSEADWLGLFVLLVLGVGYTLVILVLRALSFSQFRAKRGLVLLLVLGTLAFLTLVLTVLILTVARSAWLGAGVLTVVFVAGLSLEAYRRATVLRVGGFLVSVFFSFLCAALFVSVFHLSSFQFLNRLESTGSGWQTITISCEQEVSLPAHISSLDELIPLGCRHIDLEVIEAEKMSGHQIKEVARPDPNISLRQDIYHMVWNILKEHPLLGVGWGSAASFLGHDERGAGLNASNMFLEVWLGSGLLGFLTVVIWWGLLVYGALSVLIKKEPASENEEWLWALFLLATLSGLTVCNLFNSGILLGFFFLFLSGYALLLEKLPPLFTKKSSV